MVKCFICGEELTGEAVEHIIPSALGGKLKADILCKEHNSTFGGSIDADLVEAMVVCTNLLNPKRGRGGKHPDLDYNSEKGKIRRSADGKLSQKEIRPATNENGDTGITVSIMGENVEEKTKKISSDYIRKMGRNKGRSEEQIQREIEESNQHIEGKSEVIPCPELHIQFRLGAKDSWLGVLKIAIEFAIMNDVDKAHFVDKIEVLRNRDVEKIKTFSGFYFPEGVYPKDTICNTLVLVGNNHEGILYCLVSIYNVWNSLIVLSDSYEGQDTRKSYCYDLQRREEKDGEIRPSVLKKNYLLQSIKARDNSSELTRHINDFCSFFSINKH
jgi:hypothetical protein